MRLFRRHRSDADFEAEVQLHLEHEADRLRAEGYSENEASMLARAEFGNVTAARERFYESRRRRWLDTLVQDTRYALRALGRAPGYTAAAIVTLALGIGANTAIFSTLDDVLFRPLDVPDAGRLAQVYSFNRKTSTYLSSSFPDYLDFRSRAHSFQALAAYVRFPLTVMVGEGAERISVEAVSDNYFQMLNLPPLAGRALGAEDDLPGASPAALISEGLWRRRFQSAPQAIGRTIGIEGRSFTVAGVVPDRLAGLNLNWATPPQIWIPLHTAAAVLPRLDAIKIFENRAAVWLVLTGRLKQGVSMEAAQAELQAVAGNLSRANPASNRDLTAVVFPLSHSKFWPSYRKTVANSLAAFAIACGLILLLACANVSNLLLERAVSRRREFAVRLALGAGRARLVRQLLTESAVLAVLSCPAALLAAHGLMRLLLQFPNALGLTLALDLHVDPRAMAFCLSLSLSTVAVFGLAPALQATRLEILPSLKQSGNAASGPRRDWFRSGLVAAQAGFSMILLIGGALYGRTLWNAYSTDLGFRSSNVLTAAFSLPMSGGDSAERMRNAQRMFVQRVAALPGVVSASVSSTAILSPVFAKAQVDPGAGPASIRSAGRELAGPEFLQTMGIGIAAGRDFQERDNAAAPKVAIVNQTLAASLGFDGAPVGRTVFIEDAARKRTAVTIVGVARDAKYSSIWEQPQAHLYLPIEQADVPGAYLTVRTSARPGDLAQAVRKLWNDLAPLEPLYDMQTADERVHVFLAPQRVAAGILGGFGTLAIILTAVGLYSVVAFSVAQRRREIGIRIAIGARPGTVFTAVLRKSVVPALAGLAFGTAASFPLMRLLAANIKDVSSHDGPTYAAVALLLAVVACAAAIIPARRAMRIDPAIALRSD